MAILGGAGNPVGGSFTGPAQALDIYGDFGAAYSGRVDVNNTETELIEFTSGNFVLVGHWQGSYYTAAKADDFRWIIYLNGAQIQSYIAESSLRGNPRSQFNLIIPAYTEVKLTSQNVEGSSTEEMMASITGRIYRTRD